MNYSNSKHKKYNLTFILDYVIYESTERDLRIVQRVIIVKNKTKMIVHFLKLCQCRTSLTTNTFKVKQNC